MSFDTTRKIGSFLKCSLIRPWPLFFYTYNHFDSHFLYKYGSFAFDNEVIVNEFLMNALNAIEAIFMDEVTEN